VEIKLYSMLPEKYSRQIANKVGLQLTDEYTRDDVISIIVRKNPACGVDDPTEYIKNPNAAIVVAGTPDKTGEEFFNKAVQAGVPDNNIFVLPPKQPLSPKQLVEKVKEVHDRILSQQQEEPVDDEDAMFLDFESEKQESQATSQRIKVVAVRGFRGGVGTTTIATSLAGYFCDLGGKVAVIDLGMPPNVKYHTPDVKFERKEVFLLSQCEQWDLYTLPMPVWLLKPEDLSQLVENLRKEYRWTVVDFSPQPDREHVNAVRPDITVAIMDHDVTQSVEPLQKQTAKMDTPVVYVYNKVVPDVPIDVIESIINGPVVTIKPDVSGCSAGLTSSMPAYRYSEVLAKGIGHIAGSIQ